MDASKSKHSMNLYWFLNFKMSLCWAVLIAVFHAAKVNSYWRNNNLLEMSSKSHFFSLHYYFKMVSLTYTAGDFYEQASHVRGSQTNFTVSPRSSNDLQSIFSVCFHLNRVGMAMTTSHQRSILAKYLNSISWSSLFNLLYSCCVSGCFW